MSVNIWNILDGRRVVLASASPRRRELMKLLTDDIVYGKREECVYNHTVALWQNVPTGILRRYVKNTELAEELKAFKGTHVLFCKGDLPLPRLYRLLRYYAAQYHNFRDYYFEKT